MQKAESWHLRLITATIQLPHCTDTVPRARRQKHSILQPSTFIYKLTQIHSLLQYALPALRDHSTEIYIDTYLSQKDGSLLFLNYYRIFGISGIMDIVMCLQTTNKNQEDAPNRCSNFPFNPLKTSNFLFNPLTLRWLMSYIYGAPILDVSISHTTTQHSR